MKKTVKILIIAVALLFIYAPIILLFIYSFTKSKTIGLWTGFSLDLYGRLFTVRQLRSMIVDTLVLALLAAFSFQQFFYHILIFEPKILCYCFLTFPT